MKTQSLRRLAALSLVGVLPLIGSPALAYSGQNLAPAAKISIERARQIAHKAYPGRITDEELEREGGGSGLRYSFDIQNGKVTQEVGIDAISGRVLENKPEGKNPD